MAELLMPSLGADMDEGTLVRWLVAPGDHVERGQSVAEVDTDKAVLEIEAFVSGVVDALLVQEGETVAVGTPLASIRTKDARPPSPPSTDAGAPVVEQPPPARTRVETRALAAEHVHSPLVRRRARELGVDLTKVTGTGSDGTITRADVERAGATTTRPAAQGTGDRSRVPGVKATPAARSLAASSGLDLAAIDGTGPDGAIVRADVEEAARSAAAVPSQPRGAAPQPVPDRRTTLRSAIARLMSRSKREIPHYYLSADVDMTAALTWLDDYNAARPAPERLLPAALLLRAVVVAVAEVPEMNGYYLDDTFHASAAVHLGVAVSLRDAGLVAPAIRDAERKSVGEVMDELRGIVKRARSGVMRASDMSDPTISVTSLGDRGVDTVFGVIYPPQVALVGFGRIAERPWTTAGMVGAHRTVTVTLAADHRVSDGHRGGLFLEAIDERLQAPEAL